MKIFKVFVISLSLIGFVWIGRIIYPLFMIYLNDVVLLTIHEKDGSDRLVAKKYLEKTYELQHDLILIQFETNGAFQIMTQFCLDNGQIIPQSPFLEQAVNWERITKGTHFIIKKVMVQFLHSQEELKTPKFYAWVEGHESKGLVDVSRLLPLDYFYLEEREKVCDLQIAIMESINPDWKLIQLAK